MASSIAVQEKYSTYELVRDLTPYLKQYSGRIVFSTILRVIGDVLTLYPAYALASVVNFLTAYEAGTSLDPLWTIFYLFCASIIIQSIAHYYAKMIMFSTSEQVDQDLRLASMQHMFKLDIGWHEHENTGNKLKKMTRGSDSADRILRIWVNNMLPIIVSFIGTLAVIATVDRMIAAVTLAFITTYYVIARVMRKHAAQATIVANLQEEHVEGLLFESLNNIRTIKVLGMAQLLMERLTESSRDLYTKIRRRIFWFQSSQYSRMAYARLFEVCMLGAIVIGITNGRYEVGFLILFSGYFRNLLQAISELAEIAQDYIVAKISIGRMFEIHREPVRIDTEEGKSLFPADWKTISFKNVSFAYGDNQVLDDVSFDIRRGEKVGIVGLSGAGKSTLFKLLLKEHESYTGEILVDDVPLRTISRQEYFNHAAVVLQDTEVFNFSLKENVTLANPPEIDNAELLDRALRVAYVSDFAHRMPEGIETLIGEKGIRLSGGERQRVGIARAVFKNPEILFLDEATSHLDIESEEKIQASLHEFFNSVTAVVIAHRLTTIKEMDTILVMEGGRVIESGNFKELYAKQGRFHELWEKQNL